MSTFETTSMNFAIFLLYLFPDQYEGVKLKTDKGDSAVFSFRKEDGIDYLELKRQFEQPGSVIVSDAKAFLLVSSDVRRDLARAKENNRR
jgi:hypothetical protein